MKCFIFDLDGTLLDTEKLYRKYWPMALKDFGYELSDERALMLRSLGRPFAPEQFKKWYGESFDYSAVRNRRKEYVALHIAEHGIELRPGVCKLLDFLETNHIRRAIATATDLERTTSYLKMVGLDGRFEEIVCATMVEHGKPAPDIYKYAVDKLGCADDISEVYAVEDAPNGVLSAFRAGLKVIYVPDQTPSDEELKKYIYREVKSLDQIIDLVETLDL